MAFCGRLALGGQLLAAPGANTASSNNFESFHRVHPGTNLGQTRVGLLRADSGFYDKTIVARLTAKKINHIISARLTQGLQQAIVDGCKWQQVEVGLEVSELNYQPHGWDAPQRLVVVRQHIQRKKRCSSGQDAVAVCRRPRSTGLAFTGRC
jgi:hypothetical protein